MKKFLIRVSLFVMLLAMSILTVFFMANGRSDSFYLRFTSKKQSSLIIGTSRAAQGLQPAVLNAIIYNESAKRFYNYSFSLLDSPFGPAYYESIQKKLDPNASDGIFIISVDPWSISGKTEAPDNTAGFDENKGFVGKTKYVNLDPNIPYLVSSYQEPYINIILKRNRKTPLFLHEDGWLEVNATEDSAALVKSREEKLAYYRKNYLPAYRYSAARFKYFIKTIDLLKMHGTVYLVRLPVDKKMFDIEDELMPGFDSTMDNFARKKGVQFFNFRKLKNEYRYVDGHHLHQNSGKEVSAVIAGWILQTQLNKKQ